MGNMECDTEITNPQWWKYYNKVKHERIDIEIFLKKANLENVMNAIAALYILERDICKELCDGSNAGPTIPSIQSSLFNIVTEGWSNDILLCNGQIWIKT